MRRIIVLLFLFSTLFSSAQKIKTYSGSYTPADKSIKGKVTYQYYEDDNFVRVYHGNFKIIGGVYDNFTGKRTSNFSISGKFQNNLRVGKWTASFRITKSNKIILSESFSANYKEGKLHGKSHIKRISKTGKFTDISNILLTFSNNKPVGLLNVKTTINGVVTEQIKGNFNKNGYLDGKFLIRYILGTRFYNTTQLRSIPVIEDIREYKNGLCYKNIVRNTSTGEIIKDYNNIKYINNFSEHLDDEINISVYDKNIFSLVDILDEKIFFGSAEGSHRLSLIFLWDDDEIGNHLNQVPLGQIKRNFIVEKSIENIGTIQDIKDKVAQLANDNNFNDALKYLKIIIKSDTANFKYKILYGKYLIFNKQFSKAETYLKEISKFCKNTEHQLSIDKNLSHSYLLNNNYEKALALIKRNISKTKDNNWLNEIYIDFKKI